jgi:tRNA-splicing ligase RtcB (3'-phosphate/5'-hydroxy nucleic acid ligase)
MRRRKAERVHSPSAVDPAQPRNRRFHLMNTQDLIRLGVPPGDTTRRGIEFISRYILKGLDKSRLRAEVEAVVTDPASFQDDDLRGEFARALLRSHRTIRTAPAAWRQWGEGLEPEAQNQMGRACQLPVAVAGALMPDAHVGYGLPIGGVLATDNAVIPYAVGVDIACRMKLTVLDLPLRDLERQREKLIKAIEAETRFGVGATFKQRRDHEVLAADWSVSRITRENKDRAWAQLGTSGSGNHFVEFGLFTAEQPVGELPAGQYVALLSHSGSRGTGAAVCSHYSKLAMARHPDLPKEHKHLAWLYLDTDDGREYWAAMELMGRYAAANHALIHHHLTRHLRLQVLLDVENHHNFAWKERHTINGVSRDVIVHRKGATPAGEGVLGIIPGSMASPGFLVRGKGNPESLRSASHGAGRVMSRTRALTTFDWGKVNRVLKERGVKLISAGLDEVPGVYKNIHEVMAAQTDLVDVLAKFDPKLVKMAPHGERPED